MLYNMCEEKRSCIWCATNFNFSQSCLFDETRLKDWFLLRHEDQ